ncbi:MAG: hypothetical protein QNJ38_20520 [Prochloraceae cyanobacterium]|nr:hypothetical protein [Prochloraceae cyanobacterium]
MVTMYESKTKIDPRIRNNKGKIKDFKLKNLIENLQSAFASKNIQVEVNSRNNILEIYLQGNIKPNQKDALQTIQKQLFPLNTSHHFVKIYGTNLNIKSQRWVKEINLKNCCPQCSKKVTYIFRSKQVNLKLCTSCKWPLNNAFSHAENLANKVFKSYRIQEKNFISWYLNIFKKPQKNTKEIALIVFIPLMALLLAFGISWKLNYQPNYAVNYDSQAPSQYFLYQEIETSGAPRSGSLRDRPTLLWKRQEGVCLYISHYSGSDRENFANRIKTEYSAKCVSYLD